MDCEVFISYSSIENNIANELCQYLESNDIKCWIAPRDLKSGEEYAEVIPLAIKSCKIFIVILSEAANLSRWVKSEIRIAFDNNIYILTFRIDKTEPAGQMEIYLKGQHWLDAYSDPSEKFKQLSDDVRRLLDNKTLSSRQKIGNRNIKYYAVISVITIIMLTAIFSGKLKKIFNNDEVSIGGASSAVTLATTPVSVSYKLDKPKFVGQGSELYGYVEGQKYRIEIDNDIQCMKLIKEYDFDGDGIKDALIENISACGGNGSANMYFFVSYKGEGFFQVSKQFGYCWKDAKLEKWNNMMSVIVESDNAGYNNDETRNVRERYILKDGKAVLVESIKKNKLVVLTQINSTDFNEKNTDEEKYIMFDLDEDGIKDKIICTYWERWGSVMISRIEFSSGMITEPSTGCKRVGVLETKTNNVHDLVCGEDDILRWNGKEYK